MKKIVYAVVFCCSLLYANDTGFHFYSGELLFKPLVANTFEPRMGLLWQLSGNKLRLDIGNSVDLLEYQFENPKQSLTIGSDFFTYTFLRGETHFHFPVDAVDYLFGFNINYKDTLETGILSARLRTSHISAHFVDGHFDNFVHAWKDNRSPRVYSREFFDLAIAFEPTASVRPYLGAIYVWHIDPTTLPRYAVYAGGEFHQSINSVLHSYISYQATFSGMVPRHQLQAGAKIGNWNGRGLNIFFAYFSGNSIHGEYFDLKEKYSGVGFVIDF